VSVLVDVEQISMRTPDRVLFDQLSLTVSSGQRIGVVGINGTGKSTLLRVLAGAAEPEAGSVRRGRGVRVGYLDQEPVLGSGTVRDAVGSGWEAEAVLDRLGMGAEVSTDVSTLSGGQAKRVALARVLALPSELLVLDEPTNHLDLSAIAWLEQQLLDYRGGLVIVSHDRHLLDRVTTRMLELDRGSRYLHEGGYASYLEARAERDERAASAEAVRRNLARRELAWLRRGAKARTSKSKARLDSAAVLLETRALAPARSTDLSLKIGTPRLGDKVIELSDVAFRYGPDTDPVFSGVDLNLGPRERLGIVGANGTGKSTLLDVLSGRKDPSSGTIEVGVTVVIGYYDQTGVELDPAARVQDLVAGPTRTPGSLEDIALMERFWFTGDLPFARVGTLSGGERRRLQLLIVLARRPNVLLLDEPTNDLDLDTLRILEEFLEEWPGALVVVSHDRTFLERTADRFIAASSDGMVRDVAGDLDSWIAADRTAARVSVQSPRPTQVRGESATKPSGRSRSTIHFETRRTEQEMARLEKRRDELTAAFSGVVERDELARLGSELAAVHARLADVENQWLALVQESEQSH
jgi:ABC transport system ATP-binding/permease protein